MILYVPRFLTPVQRKSILAACGKGWRLKPAPVSQRAWATGAPSTEVNCLILKVNGMIRQWQDEEIQ